MHNLNPKPPPESIAIVPDAPMNETVAYESARTQFSSKERILDLTDPCIITHPLKYFLLN